MSGENASGLARGAGEAGVDVGPQQRQQQAVLDGTAVSCLAAQQRPSYDSLLSYCCRRRGGRLGSSSSSSTLPNRTMSTTAAAAAATAVSPDAPHTVTDAVTLTPAERELFDTLLAVVQHAGAATVLRCAGGWVRDKLLGKGSDDIDVALDDRMGRDFAELVNDYLKAQ
ncbi:CCA tRNA nucleotidyltransferase, mitochondrial, partial [Tetrabaena socialis]